MREKMDDLLSTLKLELIHMNFPSKIPVTEDTFLGLFYALENEDVKLVYITKFMQLDKTIFPLMIEATRHWKYTFTFKLYTHIYQTCRQKHTRLLCISFFLSHQKHDSDMIEELFRLMNEEHDYEAYDVLQRFRYSFTPAQQRNIHEWFEAYRFREERPTHGETIKNSQKTVYNDAQNVHHQEINDSLWKNINIITSNQPSISSDSFDLLKVQLGYLTQRQRHALFRMENDHSTFSKKNVIIRFKDVLDHVSSYILQQSQDVQSELLKRVKEELDDMSGTCASGHLSRVMNCLIGFHPDIEMNIGENHRVFSILNKTIENLVLKEENNQELMTDMILPSVHGPFYTFLLDKKDIILKSVGDTTQLSHKELTPFLREAWDKMYPHVPSPFEHEPRVKNKNVFPCLSFLSKKKQD